MAFLVPLALFSVLAALDRIGLIPDLSFRFDDLSWPLLAVVLVEIATVLGVVLVLVGVVSGVVARRRVPTEGTLFTGRERVFLGVAAAATLVAVVPGPGSGSGGCGGLEVATMPVLAEGTGPLARDALVLRAVISRDGGDRDNVMVEFDVLAPGEQRAVAGGASLSDADGVAVLDISTVLESEQAVAEAARGDRLVVSAGTGVVNAPCEVSATVPFSFDPSGCIPVELEASPVKARSGEDPEMRARVLVEGRKEADVGVIFQAVRNADDPEPIDEADEVTDANGIASAFLRSPEHVLRAARKVRVVVQRPSGDLWPAEPWQNYCRTIDVVPFSYVG